MRYIHDRITVGLKLRKRESFISLKILPSSTKEPISKERIMEMVRWGIYICCFVGIILHLNEHENVLFEVQKGFQRDIMFIFFFLFLFTLQHIQLFNRQSAVVSVIFIVISVFQVRFYEGSPDLVRNAILDQVVLWMALMLVTDTVVTGRVRRFQKMNVSFFIYLCFLTVWLLLFREGRSVPLFYLYCILLCLIPAEEKEWNYVLDAILVAGLISLIAVVIISEGINPLKQSFEKVQRWYGGFQTLGTFGQFIGLETVLATVALFRIKSRFKNRPVFYVVCGLWLLGTFMLAILCGVLNYAIGFTLFLLTVFVFGFKKSTFPWLIIRGLIAVSVLLLLGILILDFIPVVVSPDYDNAALQRIIDNTPLHYFPAGAEELIGKIQSLHEYRRSNYNFVSVNADFQNNPIVVFLNMIGSGRASIWYVFLQNTSFEPGSGGLNVGTIFSLHAHNEYIQLLYEYGFFAGGLTILFFVTGWIISVIRYVKDKNDLFFFPVVILPMMLGMWVGEMSTVYFSLTGISLICLMTVILFGGRNSFEEAVNNE